MQLTSFTFTCCISFHQDLLHRSCQLEKKNLYEHLVLLAHGVVNNLDISCTPHTGFPFLHLLFTKQEFSSLALKTNIFMKVVLNCVNFDLSIKSKKKNICCSYCFPFLKTSSAVVFSMIFLPCNTLLTIFYLL